MLLPKEEKQRIATSVFHETIDLELSSNSIPNEIKSFVNLVIDIDDIDYNVDPLLNEDKNNVFFTPFGSSDIYQYEYYNGAYFIRMNPFAQKITMHFVPKKYDASNTDAEDSILLFKDTPNEIENATINMTSEYTKDSNKIKNIFNTESDSPNQAIQYNFSVKNRTKGLKKIQINAKYSYDETSSSINHMTGLLDLSNMYQQDLSVEDLTPWNSSLIDFVTEDKNKVFQLPCSTLKRSLGEDWAISWVPNNCISSGENNLHTIGSNKYKRTLKYFNDSLYIEDGNIYTIQPWTEECSRQ